MSNQKKSIKKILESTKGKIEEQSSEQKALAIIQYLQRQVGTTDEAGDLTAQKIIMLTWSGSVDVGQAHMIMTTVEPFPADIGYEIGVTGIVSRGVEEKPTFNSSWDDELNYLVKEVDYKTLDYAYSLLPVSEGKRETVDEGEYDLNPSDNIPGSPIGPPTADNMDVTSRQLSTIIYQLNELKGYPVFSVEDDIKIINEVGPDVVRALENLTVWVYKGRSLKK